MRRLSFILVLTLAVSACGGDAPREIIDPEQGSGGVGGSDAGGRLRDIPGLFGGGESGAGGGLTAVNRYLWRASLDTLSFLPLSSTDPFTGVIATDWAASPEAPTERLKVTAYVTSPTLAAGSLDVAVFREMRGEQGEWVTAPVSSATARQLEDAILLRARQLRIADREAS